MTKPTQAFTTDAVDLERRLQFSDALYALTNKIHATDGIDQIMLDLADDICELFRCDRLTLYAVNKGNNTLVSKVKTGINSSKDLILPINTTSIAGFVALTHQAVSIGDVYDNAELAAVGEGLAFCHKVDQITGYHTMQMMAAPLLRANSQEVLGVIQLINNRNGGNFADFVQDGLKQFCATLAVAFNQRMKIGFPELVAAPVAPVAPVPAAPPPPASEALADKLRATEQRLQFARDLQSLTNRIHGAVDIDAIRQGLEHDVCALFNCDRMTMYLADHENNTLVAHIKTGLSATKELVLPLDTATIAGNVGVTRRAVRIDDVYAKAELDAMKRDLTFYPGVDEASGFRTKQMLVAPILNDTGQLLGVIQLMNIREGVVFSNLAEMGLSDLCDTLAIAFSQKKKRPAAADRRYAGLVLAGSVAGEELELAAGWARRHKVDLEEVLASEFGVPLAAIGKALASHFNVPYAAHRSTWHKPADLIKDKDRAFFERHQWLPMEKERIGLRVLTTDPELVRSARVINEHFPYGSHLYQVTTKREFRQTLDLWFGPKAS